MWTFDPHVATQIYDDMLRDVRDKVTVFKGERLDLAKGVVKQGARIVRVVMESGRAFEGRMDLCRPGPCSTAVMRSQRDQVHVDVAEALQDRGGRHATECTGRVRREASPS